jgi:hypothetical protein
MTEDRYPAPPAAKEEAMHGRHEVSRVLRIEGSWVTSYIEVFYSPNWTAVYVQGDLVETFGMEDTEYFRAMQFALDLHKLEVAEL